MELLEKIEKHYFFCDRCKKKTAFHKKNKLSKLHRVDIEKRFTLENNYSVYKCSICGWSWWGLDENGSN